MYDIVNFNADIIEDERLLDGLPVKSEKRYEFLRTIGFGKLSAVVLVNDTETERTVAMARVPDAFRRSRAELARFIYEAKVVARLEHPNIIPIHEIGMSENGSPFFTMKYLRGDTLAVILDRLRNGNEKTMAEFPPEKLLRFFIRVCNAVDFAHASGFGHFDLRPEHVNIGIFGDVVVFGWSRTRMLDVADYEKADSVNMIGKPGFLAPEQIKSNSGSTVGRAADIYALGAVLYTIITLHEPFANRSRPEALQLTPRAGYPDPESYRGESTPVPEALADVAKKAMSTAPSARYGSAGELAAEVLAYLNGYATKAENATVLKRLSLFAGRRRAMLLAAAAALFLALALLLALLLWRAS